MKLFLQTKKMLEQQEADKAVIEQKQAENQAAINTVAANKQLLNKTKQLWQLNKLNWKQLN